MDSILSNKKLRVHEKNMALARIPTYKIGDLVFVQHELARSKSRVGHVQPYTGPWRVTARLGVTTYTVEPVDPSCKPRLSSINVHTGRLKPYVRGQPEPASAAGAEQVAWQAVPASGASTAPASSAPALLTPSEHSRPFLGSMSAEEHHELSSDRQLRREAERAADESKEDFDFTATSQASPPPTQMEIDEQSSVSTSVAASAPPTLGSAAQAARGRHHNQDRPDYSENSLVPTEPRPQERYSLPSRVREQPPMAFHTRGSQRK